MWGWGWRLGFCCDSTQFFNQTKYFNKTQYFYQTQYFYPTPYFYQIQYFYPCLKFSSEFIPWSPNTENVPGITPDLDQLTQHWNHNFFPGGMQDFCSHSWCCSTQLLIIHWDCSSSGWILEVGEVPRGSLMEVPPSEPSSWAEPSLVSPQNSSVRWSHLNQEDKEELKN